MILHFVLAIPVPEANNGRPNSLHANAYLKRSTISQTSVARWGVV